MTQTTILQTTGKKIILHPTDFRKKNLPPNTFSHITIFSSFYVKWALFQNSSCRVSASPKSVACDPTKRSYFSRISSLVRRLSWSASASNSRCLASASLWSKSGGIIHSRTWKKKRFWIHILEEKNVRRISGEKFSFRHHHH